MAEVLLEKMGKVYGGDVVALKDMDLDIPDGEFVVFVGPSGCGKSTALRMIAGLEDITSGSVVMGMSIRGIRSSRAARARKRRTTFCKWRSAKQTTQ